MSRCRDCIHYGCCDGLPNCGGGCFTSRWTECAQCGREIEWGSAITFGGYIAFCDEDCAEAWEAARQYEEGGEA